MGINLTNESLMVFFTVVLSIATIILAYETRILAIHTKSLADIEKRRDRIEPLIKLFKETQKPGYSKWRFNITNPTGKPIRDCWVLSNEEQLPWANKDKPCSKIIIPSGGAENVMIPDKIKVEGTYIQIKDGEEILLDIKYEDIRE